MFRQRFRSRLRSIMRGYSRIRKNRDISRLRAVKERLSAKTLTGIDGHTSEHVFGASNSQAELMLRQLLLQRHAGAGFLRAILYSLGRRNGSVVYPLPKDWRNVLLDSGIPVNQHYSAIAWMGLIVLYWGHGVIQCLRLVARSLATPLLASSGSGENHVYFAGLTENNLPRPGADGRSYDICSWYAHWEGRLSGLDAICHSVPSDNVATANGIPVVYVAPPFQRINGWRAGCQFIWWGLKAIGIATMDLMRGRWWHSVILGEAAHAKAVQLLGTREIAKQYLFHYSGTIYRPMWTYEAEKKGASIICYFYSTSEQVKLRTGYHSQRYEWGAASWPTYLVWDEFQAATIRREIDSPSEIKVVGPIDFSSTALEPPPLPPNTIAVFDIQPPRSSLHFAMSTLADYYAENKNVRIRFIQDIHAVIAEAKFAMAFKRKRDIGNLVPKGYLFWLDVISRSSNVVVVPPAIPVDTVVEHCVAVISAPFTSTALYGRKKGIPSVYYDPTGWIQKDDRGAHGIPIVSGIGELRDWIRSID